MATILRLSALRSFNVTSTQLSRRGTHRSFHTSTVKRFNFSRPQLAAAKDTDIFARLSAFVQQADTDFRGKSDEERSQEPAEKERELEFFDAPVYEPEDPKIEELRARIRSEELGQYIKGDGTLEEESIVEIAKTRSFILTTEDVKKFLPEGVPNRIKKLGETYFKGEPVLYERAITRRIIRQLCDAYEGGFKEDYSVVLDGEVASGKSVALLQIALWCRKAGWIVLYVPDGYKFLNGGNYIQESKISPGSYDQPDLGAAIMKHMIHCHRGQLSNVSLKTNPQLPEFRGSTLLDLANYGSSPNRLEHAGDAMYYFRRELNLVTEYPVVIVLDGINSLFEPTIFGDVNKLRTMSFARLQPHQLALPSTMLSWKDHGMINGAMVCCTDRHRTMKHFNRANPTVRSLSFHRWTSWRHH